jgi:hypothetical protein
MVELSALAGSGGQPREAAEEGIPRPGPPGSRTTGDWQAGFNTGRLSASVGPSHCRRLAKSPRTHST